MNYRHAYHAGNFADVFKHIVLTRILEHLKGKEKAFRVIDTHAGCGIYERSAIPPAASGKPPEWQGGVGRMTGWELPTQAAALFEPYLSALFQEAPRDRVPGLLPGSPMIALRGMRRQDRLSACELHDQSAAMLKHAFEGNFQVRVMELDGWLVPGSQIPPKEKRGMVLIDPPFEQGDDFARMADALKTIDKRWNGGTVALWYPLKHSRQVADFHNVLTASGVRSLLVTEISITKPQDPPVLHGCGMVIRRPPFRLAGELREILPLLADRLELEPGAGSWSVRELVPE